MTLPRHLLVPIDFSDNAEAALDYAVALAGKLDAEVHLLHVIGAQLLAAEHGFTMTSAMVDQLLAADRDALDQLVAARRGQARFAPPRIELGDARTQIEQVAATLDAPLIVMGSHGRRGARRILPGSVAEAVVRTAPCPVLLVRAP